MVSPEPVFYSFASASRRRICSGYQLERRREIIKLRHAFRKSSILLFHSEWSKSLSPSALINENDVTNVTEYLHSGANAGWAAGHRHRLPDDSIT